VAPTSCGAARPSAAPAPPQYPARRRQRGRHARDLLDQLGVVRHHAHPPPHGLAQAQVLDGERVGPDRLLVGTLLKRDEVARSAPKSSF